MRHLRLLPSSGNRLKLALLQNHPRSGDAIRVPRIEAHASTLRASANVGVLAQHAVFARAEQAPASLIDPRGNGCRTEAYILDDAGNRIRGLGIIGGGLK